MSATQDSDGPGASRGIDLGRTQNIETLVRHREAVEQRLSSSLRQTEVVDGALAELDQQLAEVDEAVLDSAQRASARAYVTLVPDRSGLGVRVRKTLFRLQADLVKAAPTHPMERTSPE